MIDPESQLGAELQRLWKDGRICYLRDEGTLYCDERNQQFGVSNKDQILKFDRGSNTWFVYDEDGQVFKPISSLLPGEQYRKLKVEQLEELMFKPESSRAWKNFV